MTADSQLTATVRRSNLSPGLGLILDAAKALTGGITNTTWRVPANGGDAVVKLYSTPASANPLFPNNPDDEANALRLLAGNNIAPELLATSSGLDELVVYRFIEGQPWDGQFEEAAQLFSRLHEQDVQPSNPLLPRRHLEVGALGALNRGDQMLRQCTSSHLARRVAHSRPTPQPDNPGPPAIIHGDPTVANLVNATGGLRLIDWQCPALGDPVHDLAIFLSPMMMLLHGAGPITADEQATFLAAYPSQTTADRYRTNIASWHWQLASYGTFRCQQLSDLDPRLSELYRSATELELGIVEQK